MALVLSMQLHMGAFAIPCLDADQRLGTQMITRMLINQNTLHSRCRTSHREDGSEV